MLNENVKFNLGFFDFISLTGWKPLWTKWKEIAK